MDREFPIPFGGIAVAVSPGGDVEFEQALLHLSRGCGQGHAHNFAVETDAEPARIYTSELGARCLQAWKEGQR